LSENLLGDSRVLRPENGIVGLRIT
jgi:hypothetical protein